MAVKKIQFELDVDGKPIDVIIDKTLNLKQQFRELTKEINKTQEGTKEFELLSTKIGDVKDKMETTTAKSRDLFGSLSLLPGPVGMFANSVDSAIGSLKLFSSFNMKDLKFQLGETLNDFKDIASNIGKATGITKIYTVLNNALAKSFAAVGVGEEAAAVGAKGLSAALTATGIGAIVVALGFLVTKLMEYGDEAEKTAEKQKALNEEMAKGAQAGTDAVVKFLNQSEKLDVQRAKNAGKTEAEIQAIREDYAKRRETQLQKNLKALEGIQGADASKAADALADEQQNNLQQREEYNGQVIEKQKEANKKLLEKQKEYQDQVKADNKTADQALIDLKRENAALAIKDERKRQDKELENQKLAEEAKINALKISAEKRAIIIGQIELKYKEKQSDVDKKRNEDDLKALEDFNRKVADIHNTTIKDETDRAIAERQQKYNNDLADLEKDKEFIKKSEQEKTQIRKDLALGAENDINKIKFDAQMKGYQDELTLLEAQQKSLQVGTQAYTDNAIAIENQAYAIKIANAKDNAKQIEAINLEHTQNLKNIDLAAFEAKKQIEIQKYGVVAGIGASLQQLAGKNKELAIGGLVIEKAAAIGQIWANNAIANAKATAASPLTFGQPWVTINTVAAALSTAATVAAAAKAIGEINGQSEGGSGGVSAPESLGKNYGAGGLLEGPRHAQGGVMINAEGGEAVMTRGAVTMFAPLLSALNQMGGGTSFSQGAIGGSRYDSPDLSTPAQQAAPMIMKTYVVENELTTAQHKQARLKDLSTL